MSDSDDPTYTVEQNERIAIMMFDGRLSEQDAIDYVELEELERKAEEVQNG